MQQESSETVSPVVSPSESPKVDSAPKVHTNSCGTKGCHEHHDHREVWARNTPKIGRNDSCPCGSGKKYKKCCLA